MTDSEITEKAKTRTDDFILMMHQVAPNSVPFETIEILKKGLVQGYELALIDLFKREESTK